MSIFLKVEACYRHDNVLGFRRVTGALEPLEKPQAPDVRVVQCFASWEVMPDRRPMTVTVTRDLWERGWRDSPALPAPLTISALPLHIPPPSITITAFWQNIINSSFVKGGSLSRWLCWRAKKWRAVNSCYLCFSCQIMSLCYLAFHHGSSHCISCAFQNACICDM